MRIVSFANVSPERWWRLDIPKKWVERYTSHTWRIFDLTSWFRYIESADLIIGRSFISPKTVDLIHAFGKKIVYELDGAAPLYPRTRSVTRGLVQSEETNSALVETMKKCDGVFVSTMPLKKWVRSFYTREIYLFPNYMDFEWWDKKVVVIDAKKRGEIRIGWFGMFSHIPDIVLTLLPILRSLQQKRNIFFYIPRSVKQAIPHLLHRQIRFIPSWTMEERPALARQHEIDMCLVFLSQTPFNECKSAIKYFENAADKIPGIYSPTVYKDYVMEGKTGLFASTHKQWIRAIESLIVNKSLYTHIAQASRAHVYKKFNAKDHYVGWVNAIEKAATA